MRILPNFWQRKGFRLPTQAEWEFVCRGGAQTRRNFGTHDELLKHYGWHQNNTVESVSQTPGARPVALLKPNAFGFFDVHGNAMEWCIDRHQNYPYGQSHAVDEPSVTDTVGFDMRSLRGGAFFDLPVYLSSGYRYGFEPSNQLIATGFRIVQTLADKTLGDENSETANSSH